MFAKAKPSPQAENTPFNPRSVYGISKVAGFHLSTNYRNLYGMFCCNGILYNHESERRGYEYVTRKIASSAANIKLGKIKSLKLGNLEARRDWGYAPDYVQGMWKIMQFETPQDFVIGTGITHSVRDFCEIAFKVLGLDWSKYVEVSEEYFRPSEEIELKANPEKARKLLGWRPSIDFETMVEKMVLADFNAIQSA